MKKNLITLIILCCLFNLNIFSQSDDLALRCLSSDEDLNILVTKYLPDKEFKLPKSVLSDTDIEPGDFILIHTKKHEEVYNGTADKNNFSARIYKPFTYETSKKFEKVEYTNNIDMDFGNLILIHRKDWEHEIGSYK